MLNKAYKFFLEELFTAVRVTDVSVDEKLNMNLILCVY